MRVLRGHQFCRASEQSITPLRLATTLCYGLLNVAIGKLADLALAR